MSHVSPLIDVKIPQARVAIVSTLWNQKIVEQLVEGAKTALDSASATFQEFHVAGAFELPLVVSQCLKTFDAAVALGVVIRGETAHFDYICSAVTSGLTQVALESQKPVGFGVLMVENVEQAEIRSEPENNKGKESAEAVLFSLKQLSEIRGQV